MPEIPPEGLLNPSLQLERHLVLIEVMSAVFLILQALTAMNGARMSYINGRVIGEKSIPRLCYSEKGWRGGMSIYNAYNQI